MEQNQINKLRELAVNAITGHTEPTVDVMHDLGVEIEELCDEVERLQMIEIAATDFVERFEQL